MRILCIQHADFETPGTIEQWASNNGHSFKVEKPYRGEQLSEIGGFDLLISMGGPQSAVRIAEFPYLQPELALIRTAFSENRKILGILDRFALSAHTVVGFSVVDITATVATLTKRGVILERIAGLPQDSVGILRTPDGAKVAWFRDLDGNLLSIVQYA